MTVHALVADPPRQGLALPELMADGHLDEESAIALAKAMLKDTALGVARSGGDLLVNHPTAEQLSSSTRWEGDPADDFRRVLSEVLTDLYAVRFEPQIGDTFAERIGNTCGHLLDEEGVVSVAVLDGLTPTLDRTDLDNAAMKLRRSGMVVAPASGGRVAYLGLTEPLDFAGLAWPLHLESVVDRAIANGIDVDFLPMHPRVSDSAGFGTLVSLIEARSAADRRVPEHTAAVIDSFDL